MAQTRRDFLKQAGWIGGAAILGVSGTGAVAQGSPLSWRPAYARLEEENNFADRVEEAYSHFEACTLCPRLCGANRLAGKTGFCRATARVKVYSHQPHYGEELPLVGRGGSGTIFFSHCNLRCVFCQNWPIAHEGHGRHIDDDDLAGMMLDLQRRGCHNINVVTPTHVMPNIVRAVHIAVKKGLRVPLCYNTSGYELPDKIRLLDGIVDIYLPDLKFMDGKEAARYAFSGREDYPQMAQQSILEMQRQVGRLETDERGIAQRGLMIRHLVMPNRVAGTREFVQWVAENLPNDTYINIMSQYRVEHRAFEHERIARAITPQEFVEAVEWAQQAGLTNLDERTLAMAQRHRRRLL